MTFEEQLQAIRTAIKGSIDSNTSKELIDNVAKWDKSLEELGTEHKKLLEENKDLKDSYIKAIQGKGFNGNINDRTGEQEPETLEQIVNRVLNDPALKEN